jgi:hypothetical protein
MRETRKINAQSTILAKHVQNVVALTISWESTRFTIANNVELLWTEN